MDRLASQTALENNIGHQEAVIKLALVCNLISGLNNRQIRYCHWKSNEHLDASMIGDTDLDILFDVKEKGLVEDFLAEMGFKKFKPAAQRSYKDIEDYIGLDVTSGRIIHLHSHFKLSIGEINLKSYQLDLEELVLSTKVYDEKFELYRTDPALELMLLFYRHAFKMRTRDRIRIVTNGEITFKKNIVREYEWLRERCTEKKLAYYVDAVSTVDSDRLFRMLTGNFNKLELVKLAVFLKQKYKSQRLYSPIRATMLRWYRELYLNAFRRFSRMVRTPMILQRSNPRGGLAIAVVGADGSGKSTVIKDLELTFRKKLDVCSIYFGKGGGRKSWYRNMLISVKRAFGRSKLQSQANGTIRLGEIKEKLNSKRSNGIGNQIYHCIEALMVAREKHTNLKKMWMARKKGMLIICDRFPQSQTLGYNDGPRLQNLRHSKNPLLRIVASKEAAVYESCEKNPPDIVFKLIARAEVIEARKPGETSLDTLRKKIDGIRQLQYSEDTKVIIVNAEEPLENVLLFIKKKIWESVK